MIYDADGKQYRPPLKNGIDLQAAEGLMAAMYADVAQRLGEQLYGQDAETRVRQLRASVLNTSVEGPSLAGLNAWLP